MSTVRQHLGLLWLLRRQLMTSNPQYDKHWAMQAALFADTHLDELIALAGGAEVEGWAREQGYEIPADFPHPAAAQPEQGMGLTDDEIVAEYGRQLERIYGEGQAHAPISSAITATIRAILARQTAPTQPEHETIVRESDRLVCTACGTTAPTVERAAVPQGHDARLAYIRDSGDEALVEDVRHGRVSIQDAVIKVARSKHSSPSPASVVQEGEHCSLCHGKGKLEGGATCPHCDGSGKEPAQQTSAQVGPSPCACWPGRTCTRSANCAAALARKDAQP